MWLSLITSGIGILNASAFLLMSAGPELLEFIVVSSIYSVAGWLYSWLLPAAVAYQHENLSLLRVLQFVTVAVATALILLTHHTIIGFVFIAMMIADVLVFPSFIMLFRSETRLYLRMELVRGVANSMAVLAVLFFLHRSPQSYVILLFINSSFGYLALAVSGLHRPPSLRVPRRLPMGQLRRGEFWSPQLRALLLARGVEMTALLGLSHIRALSPVLSLKIGLSISQALAINARSQRLATLMIVHLAVYALGTAAVIAAVALNIMPLPPSLYLISASNAVFVLPVVLASFVLTVKGLSTTAASPASAQEGDGA